ncbi:MULTISPECIES: guanylate kinase [unclassified Lactobacillus]|uniref:guanylate kinase n=1 Tax=unclassified Lactobacillus TaxID=2620435 RepID=UPI000EFA560A|nr:MULTISPECIES: AAA family ATPase [unclassified Lactobacillus]RMC23695.1 guanylate kinase [Lactobacillus sp. ESL0247]RMC27455.1 guanylate kinase [Lactobacillus sp. ESL0246]RMC30656.1 guanylate kinase [Lactobacillus sp. ESL0245]RMC47235.1 guanylate kinase [Lactobacillus sp. ESL0228]
MRKLILIAGPSGAGKTTISEYLTREFAIPRVVTHTTRPMRQEEVPNQSYYFESDASFEKLHFFEHIKYGSYQYGSSKEALDEAWQEHELVSLIVDINGVRSYLTALKQQVYFLYVTTSTKKELAARLMQRGDSPAKISERLSGSELNELPKSLKKQAHILVNDDWATTTKKLATLVPKLLKA